MGLVLRVVSIQNLDEGVNIVSSFDSVVVVESWRKIYFNLTLLSNNNMSYRTLAGCSCLGVGIKFRPLERSEVSPCVSSYLLKLMMWVMVLLNLLWCLVFFAVVFVYSGLVWLCSSSFSDLVRFLWICSLWCLVFCSIVLERFLVLLCS